MLFLLSMSPTNTKTNTNTNSILFYTCFLKFIKEKKLRKLNYFNLLFSFTSKIGAIIV